MNRLEKIITNNPNFAQIPSDYCDWANSSVVIVPAPFGKTVTYVKGTEYGPSAIIDASSQLEYYDDELGMETFRYGIHTEDFLEIDDLSPEDAIKIITEKCSKVIKNDKVPVTIGGEHSITLGPARALKEKYKDISFIVLDAHGDLRNEYEGSIYNHACISRRLSEIGKVLSIGVRSLCSEEIEFLNTAKNVQISMAKEHKKNNNIDELLDELSENVYVSIDLDAFDPSCIPSVGTPEPGGLTWYEVLDILKTICNKKNVAGFDVVELSPVEGLVASDFTAAKLIYRFIGYILLSQRRYVNGAVGSS